MDIDLEKIKLYMGITDDYQDSTISLVVNEVVQYMLEAGVKPEVVSASTSLGTIARGTLDIWNYGSGQVSFSNSFKERVIQLALK